MADLPHITIDGTQYPCREWKVEQQGQTIHEERTAFHGGMGDFYGRSSGGFYMSRQMHAAGGGFLRLRPALEETISLTSFGANANQGVFGFLEHSDVDYLYVLNGQYYWKINLSTSTVEISNPTHDFNSPSGDTTLGRPARFEGKWYLARSFFDNAVTLDTVGTTGNADTLTEITNPVAIKAMHFANIQDGLVSKIARAYRASDTKRANVDLSGDGATFAGGGEVGDGSNYIADLLSGPDGVIPCLADNIYRYSAEGEALAIQGYVGTAVSSQIAYAAYDGVNSFQHGPYTYWVHSTGLWRIIGENVLPIGPEAAREPVNMTLDNFEAYPAGDRWSSVTGWGEWLYATRGDRLYYGRIVQDGLVEWQGVLFMVNGVGLKCFITESGPDLWVTRSGNIDRFTLNQDGSLSAAKSYGAASTLFQFWLPAVTGGPGMRDKLKQWRKMWVDARNFSATAPLQLAAHMDRAAASTDVGATIEGSGLFERAWTPGTNDTAYEVIPTFEILTTAGYSPADPHIRAFGIEGVTAAVYRTRIMLTPDQLSGSLDVSSALKALQDLRNGPAVAVIPPGMNSSFNGYVTGVAEQAVSIDGGVGYAVDLFVTRWDWNITN